MGLASTPDSQWILDNVEKNYGLTGKLSKLAGEVDFNYKLGTADGQNYLVKISTDPAATHNIQLQLNISNHLISEHLPFTIPTTFTSKNGELLQKLVLPNSSEHCILRLQEWVPGMLLDDKNPRTDQLISSWGETCGHLTSALADFHDPLAKIVYRWDCLQVEANLSAKSYLSEEQVQIVDKCWPAVHTMLQNIKDVARFSVCYNDAHMHNLLCDTEIDQVAGVIDFGDAIHTATISEIAIASAYACMGQMAPLETLCLMVKSYHNIAPVPEVEIPFLYPLVLARLLNTTLIAAENAHKNPENEYLQVSAEPAWQLLTKFAQCSPDFVHFSLRKACGLPASPKSHQFSAFVKANPAAPIIAYHGKQIEKIDLSIGSKVLGNSSNYKTIKSFQKTIKRYLEDQGLEYAVGGYGEERPFYTTKAFESVGNDGKNWRTTHLGTDIWTTRPLEEVFSPFDGSVFKLANHDIERDYGACLILKHDLPDGDVFYTLFGHLSADSLSRWKVGDHVSRGQLIAHVGEPHENGQWPPHLHFQTVLEWLDNEDNYPGVCNYQEKSVWLDLCPSLPSHENFLPKPTVPIPNLLDRRKSILGPNLSISYQQPLHMVRGDGEFLIDITGRKYLDTVNNVAHVGHEHPHVVSAGKSQMNLLNTNTRYVHTSIMNYAEKMRSILPKELEVLFFVNSGSEANELALRMARTVTKKSEMLAIEVGYHGNTNAVIDVSSYKFDGKGGQGKPRGTHLLPLPDSYRKGDKACLQEMLDATADLLHDSHNVAGFIGESILSCGGQLPCPPDYLKTLYLRLRENGIITIADEVQTGLFRTGNNAWAFQEHGVVPDIVTAGKPIGNGHPLAMVATTRAIAEQFSNGMEYFNTFGGNPVSCEIGKAVLEVIEVDELANNAIYRGLQIENGLKRLAERHVIIGDIRGSGLFLGMELVLDRSTKTPASEQANYFINRMRQLGVLTSWDGPFHNVIKIKPPMCITEESVNYFLEMATMVFQENKMLV